MGRRRLRREARVPKKGASTEGLRALEIAAGLRPSLVDCAKSGDRIERNACAVATLVHAAHTCMLDHEFLGYVVRIGHELDHEVAAATAAGAGWKIV